MDSVSQILLGAACGELVLGRRVGRRAILVGAALGTLPDLDVLVPYEDAIDSFTYHRGWSHSVFVLSAASVPIAALVQLASGERGRSVGYGHWLLGVWLILVTHPLLDSFTTYGTQLWWPLPLPPVAIGSVFIIDPLYTLPLAIGVAWAWRRRDARGRAANRAGLLAGTAYLGLTLLSQAHAGRLARDSLAEQSARSARAVPSERLPPPAESTSGVAPLDAAGIPMIAAPEPGSPSNVDRAPGRLLVAPFPFSLLWRIVATDEDGEVYREGWYSLLDESRTVRFTEHEIGRELLDALAGDRRAERLVWFTDGFVRARERDDGELALTDLRIGAESGYIFSFTVAERDAGTTFPGPWRAVVARDLTPEIDVAALGWLVRRTVDESVEPPGTEDGPGDLPR